MTTFRTKWLRLLGFSGAVLLALPGARAQSFLVQWDGSYLQRQSGGTKLDLPPVTTLTPTDEASSGVGFAYSEERPIFPASGYDTTLPSAVFYGVIQATNSGPGKSEDMASILPSLNTVVANYGRNSINFAGTSPGDEGSASVSGLVFWKLKDSPLEAARSGKVKWEDIVGVSVDVTKINARLGSFRIAVQSGGKWYLSESSGTKTGWFTVNETTWGEWPVGESFPLPPVPDSFPLSSGDLKNITALGLYFTGGSASAGANATFALRSFYAEANPQSLK